MNYVVIALVIILIIVIIRQYYLEKKSIEYKEHLTNVSTNLLNSMAPFYEAVQSGTLQVQNLNVTNDITAGVVGGTTLTNDNITSNSMTVGNLTINSNSSNNNINSLTTNELNTNTLFINDTLNLASPDAVQFSGPATIPFNNCSPTQYLGTFFGGATSGNLSSYLLQTVYRGC